MASVMDGYSVQAYIDEKFDKKPDQQIADEKFISRSTLMYWKKANGLIGFRKEPFDMPERQYLDLKLVAKLPDGIIAEMLGISPVTLNRWKKSKGIKVRGWLHA
jgi:hypothetical protein